VTRHTQREPVVRQHHFVFEVTQRCNHDCLHCYNAWKNPAPYPMGELDTDATLDLLGRMLAQTGATLVTLSGGEPLLRSDLFDIVDFLVARRVAINLISNGTLLDEAAIGRLGPKKISIFELPLLAAERAVHDRMSRSDGAFDRVTMAIANLKAARQRVVCVFVATRLNLPGFREAVELAIALGADGLMLNRFNPGGEGGRHVAELQGSPAELRDALAIANEMAERYSFPISCSIPMPPCLFDASAFPRLSFGFCAAGTERAYYTLDPLGNVRPCNHSAKIVGNLFETDFATMVRSPAMAEFMSARPAFCGGCTMEDECLGGCKAAAEVCCGSPWRSDPFLEAFASEAQPELVGKGAPRSPE